MAARQVSFETVTQFLGDIYGSEVHAKRVQSLAGATLGAIESGSLAVSLIGQGLALARGLEPQHAVISRSSSVSFNLVHARLHHGGILGQNSPLTNSLPPDSLRKCW